MVLSELDRLTLGALQMLSGRVHQSQNNLVLLTRASDTVIVAMAEVETAVKAHNPEPAMVLAALAVDHAVTYVLNATNTLAVMLHALTDTMLVAKPLAAPKHQFATVG